MHRITIENKIFIYKIWHREEKKYENNIQVKQKKGKEKKKKKGSTLGLRTFVLFS
jgi:hypothetical protein